MDKMTTGKVLYIYGSEISMDKNPSNINLPADADFSVTSIKTKPIFISCPPSWWKRFLKSWKKPDPVLPWNFTIKITDKATLKGEFFIFTQDHPEFYFLSEPWLFKRNSMITILLVEREMLGNKINSVCVNLVGHKINI